MSSLILRAATRLLMPLLLLYALFLLLRGHNAPGGGFVAGLIVAAAFVLYSIAAGIPASRRALMVEPTSLLTMGLSVALASTLPSVLLGRSFMTAVWGDIGTEDFHVAVGTPLIFDIGVFLAVLGVVLTIVFTLAEDALNQD